MRISDWSSDVCSSDLKILTIPGLHNSGPAHWQSLWEHRFPHSERIELGRWDNPDKDEWVRKIAAAIEAESEPVLVAAHSLGCHAFAHWFAGASALPRTRDRKSTRLNSSH